MQSNPNYRDKCSFIRLFLSQIFDFGYSCGSLISAAIGIFRTFQRISATVSFKTKFSPDCLEMFSWATEIVKIFTSFVETNPFDDYDNFNFFTMVVPITILTYFSFLFASQSILFWYYGIIGLFIMFGAGFGFIGVNGLIAGFLIPITIIIVLIFYCCLFCDNFFDCCCCCCQNKCNCCCQDKCNCCNKKKESLDIKEAIKELSECIAQSIDLSNFFFALPPTCFLFYVLMIPLMLGRSQLIKVLSIFIGVFSGIYIMIYFIIFCRCNDVLTNIGKLGDNIINFLTNLLSLLIIPSSEYFVQLMQSKYKNDWRCILSYLILSLLLPLLLTLFNIFADHDSITGKYKDDKAFFYYIELIDIFKQLLYAILAGYDIVWACLFIDIAWAIFIAVCRPYLNKSEYFLTWGNCLVTVVSNSAIIHANINHIKTFGLAITIFLVILCCIPAIVAMYIFFIFDFDVDVNSLNKSKLQMNGFNLAFTAIFTPFSWFLYGMNLSLIDKKVYKPDI